MNPANTLVLVTGGSGCVGAHCVLAVLNAGYQVRTTVRSLERAESVHEMLRNGGAEEFAIDALQFAAADLEQDAGWDEACTGCIYILHVASPFSADASKHEDELIIPTREGTL
ncbi:hypothetical protein BU25DRAFT_424284 [Macroventuria anomochaeta]|uniref:Uncharacterized protein n=1 Tax=Macroventuria anomochaeta TaxID=301207 RepID=A0ACB6RSS3_9PLEO|nr:uncharacterized protein BU25DRAFT_424284 [Macroventuria anomochaeta]KAF2624188.1 hypothetical protein BU25DRAFT_424284 [Macroventuria anomochaeta]